MQRNATGLLRVSFCLGSPKVRDYGRGLRNTGLYLRLIKPIKGATPGLPLCKSA